MRNRSSLATNPSGFNSAAGGKPAETPFCERLLTDEASASIGCAASPRETAITVSADGEAGRASIRPRAASPRKRQTLHIPARPEQVASIRPRLQARGNPGFHPLHRGFGGEASIRPRLQARGNAGDALRRVLEDAGFNSAAPASPRKPETWTPSPRRRAASIRPRPASPRKLVPGDTPRGGTAGFNSAAAASPRKLRRDLHLDRRRWGFNSAAAASPRKLRAHRADRGDREDASIRSAACKPAETPDDSDAEPLGVTELWIGRGGKPAETELNWVASVFMARASIGSRWQARGKLGQTGRFLCCQRGASMAACKPAETRAAAAASPSSPGFNSAAASPRKRAPPFVPVVAPEASIRPPASPRKPIPTDLARMTSSRFNWLRWASPRETKRTSPTGARSPRFNSAAVASPRKRRSRPPQRAFSRVLQFGRGLQARGNTATPAARREAVARLQFGRGGKPAETGGHRPRQSRGRHGFNSAARASPRKRPRRIVHRSSHPDASIRPPASPRKLLTFVLCVYRGVRLQFGRGGKPAETGRHRRHRRARVSDRFNSAAAASPRKRRHR